MKDFLVAKFGKKEHIEQLKNGTIFFNSIEEYRNDGTTYRGDPMEGRIPIDPQTIKILDKFGNNISNIIPFPNTVIRSFINDENLFMFCASIISKNITQNKESNIKYFAEEFQTAVKEFGNYVLLLYASELLKHISNAVDENGQKISYDSRNILYRDLTDYEHTEEYRKNGSPLDNYFVKDQSYKNQNEWRVIIDGEKENLVPNCKKGFLLKTDPFKQATIMKTSDFLNCNIEFNGDKEIKISIK